MVPGAAVFRGLLSIVEAGDEGALMIVGFETLVGAAVVGIGSLWPATTLVMLLVKAATLGLAFLAGLVALGEVAADDRNAIARILGARR